MTNPTTLQTLRSGARASIAATLLAIMTGCATGPSVRPLADVETVSVEAHNPFGEVLHADEGGNVGLATGAGAGGGALYGAAAGFSCGPFFFICSPVGAVAGAIGGAVIAGTAEAVTTLPDGQGETLNTVTDDVLDRYSPADALRAAAENAARAHGKRVERADAHARLSIEIESLEWVIGSGNTVRPRAAASVTIRWPEGVIARNYVREGTRLTVAEWSRDFGTPIERGLDALFSELAEQIVTDFDAEPEPEAR